MTVAELRRTLEALPDDLEVYYSDGEEGRMDGKLPVEIIQLQTWTVDLVHQEWDGPDTGFTGGWRKVRTQHEVKGVVLG